MGSKRKKSKAANKSKKRKDLKKTLRRKENEKTIRAKDLGPIPPREISPAENLSVKEYIKKMKGVDPSFSKVLKRIREEKHQGKRLMPSSSVIGECDVLTLDQRKHLLDKIASLVDENLFRRSEMCIQFASLLEKSLNKLGINAKSISGKAEYRYGNDNWFSWDHAWVTIDDSIIIDGNTDSMRENLMVPNEVSPFPYWGLIDNLPDDRRYFPSNSTIQPDSDVEMWWQDLKAYIKNNLH